MKHAVLFVDTQNRKVYTVLANKTTATKYRTSIRRQGVTKTVIIPFLGHEDADRKTRELL